MIRGRTVEDYLKEGCELANPQAAVLIGIYHASGGQPCKECGCKPCKVFDKFSKTRSRKPVASNVKTNAEIAKERGISKRQVAKMRKEGKI